MHAFNKCSNLSEINIPENVETIGRYAFNDVAFESITIPSSVKTIGESAFNSCDNLKSVYIDDLSAWLNIEFKYDNTYQNANPLSNGAALYLKNGEAYAPVTEVTIPTSSGDDSSAITAINAYAFNGCTSITSVVIPEGITSIGTCAFDGCTSLESIATPEGLTTIGTNAFAGCGEIDVKIDDISVWTGITFGSGDYSNPLSTGGKLLVKGENGEYAELTELVIPDGTTEIADGIYSNLPITSVVIPSTVTTIGDSAFANCTKLTEVAIPEGVTTIGMNVFEGCTSLETIYLPSTLTSIGKDCFEGCIITEVYITDLDNWCNGVTVSGAYPDPSTSPFVYGAQLYARENDSGEYTEVTSVELTVGSNNQIRSYLFYGCTSITSVTIDFSDRPLVMINTGSLYCPNLTSVTFANGSSLNMLMFNNTFGDGEESIEKNITIYIDNTFTGNFTVIGGDMKPITDENSPLNRNNWETITEGTETGEAGE